MCPRLSLRPWFSAETQGDLSWRRVPDPPLALRPGPAGWTHHLASPMYDVPSGVYGAPPLRLALPPDAPGGGPGCAVSDARGAEFGALRGPLPYLAHGTLSPRLCVRPPQSGHGFDPVWTVLPTYFLADEKHSRCLTDKVYLPTIVSGRVIWHLGYTEEASATAFTQSYGAFQQAALQQEPSYRVRGILTDGFDSTTKSMRTLFPGARLGYCLRHALNKLPKKLTAIAPPVRQSLRARFHPLLSRARQRKSLRVFALGQRLRHFADHVAQNAGVANGERVRRWFQEKKAGWYVVLADPQMPATSTLLDQAHNAIERKLFAMKGFHHPGGSQQAFLTGLAHLYNLIPYQRRGKHAGQCGVAVEGGRVPTADWFLNLQILTSGGFR